jgi:hypothetical protein
LAHRLYHLAEWWHLLSLDAPTIAALWSWFFARAMHLDLPFYAPLLLALGTWLLYVADRILDGLRQRNGELLRARHHFHARHRQSFLLAASFIAVLLAWSVLTRMGAEALRDDSWIAVFAAIYLFAVHRKKSADRPRLPKELAVAILFAAATAVPAWSRLQIGRHQLIPAVIFFASLCWINCVGIEKWEATGLSAETGRAHPTTEWASLHLQSIATLVALLSLSAALLAPSRGLMAVYLAALVSSALLFLLDARSARLSPLHLRIAADAALLTPLAFFPLAR